MSLRNYGPILTQIPTVSVKNPREQIFKKKNFVFKLPPIWSYPCTRTPAWYLWEIKLSLMFLTRHFYNSVHSYFQRSRNEVMFVFLFMFFIHMKTSPFPVAKKGYNFNFYSAIQIIEHWGISRVPHLMWQGASIPKVISEDLRHFKNSCRAFGSVNCHNPPKRLKSRSDGTGNQTQIPHVLPPPSWKKIGKEIMYNDQHSKSLPWGHEVRNFVFVEKYII